MPQRLLINGSTRETGSAGKQLASCLSAKGQWTLVCTLEGRPLGFECDIQPCFSQSLLVSVTCQFLVYYKEMGTFVSKLCQQ